VLVKMKNREISISKETKEGHEPLSFKIVFYVIGNYYI